MAFQFNPSLIVDNYLRPEFDIMLANFTKSYNTSKPFRPLRELDFNIDFHYIVDLKRSTLRFLVPRAHNSVLFLSSVISNFSEEEGDLFDYNKYINQLLFSTLIIMKNMEIEASPRQINKAESNNGVHVGFGFQLKFLDSEFKVHFPEQTDIFKFQRRMVEELVQKNRKHLNSELLPFSVRLCNQGAKCKDLCETIIKKYEGIEKRLEDVLMEVLVDDRKL